jgi:hypothetical protein
MGSRARLTRVELPDACARPGATGRDGAAVRRRFSALSWPASNDHKPRPGRRSNWKTCRIWDIREAQAAPLRLLACEEKRPWTKEDHQPCRYYDRHNQYDHETTLPAFNSGYGLNSSVPHQGRSSRSSKLDAY